MKREWQEGALVWFVPSFPMEMDKDFTSLIDHQIMGSFISFEKWGSPMLKHIYFCFFFYLPYYLQPTIFLPICVFNLIETAIIDL